MSASREKHLRQGTKPVENNAVSAKPALSAKNKTVLYTAIAVVVAVLVVALLVWDSGIIQRNSTAVTIGDTSYSPAEVTYYYNTAFQNAYMLAQYGLSTYDPYKTPQDQTIVDESGKEITYHEYFLNYALEALHSITARYNAAIAAGYKETDVAATVDAQLAQEEASVKNSGYTSLKQWLAANLGKTFTPAVYRDIITRATLATLYINDYASSLQYSEDELNAYYDAHTAELNSYDFGFLFFPAASVDSKDENGNALTDAQVEEAKKKALEDAKMLADSTAKKLEAAKVSEKAELLDQLIEETDVSYSSSVATQLGSAITGTIYFDWLTADERVPGDVTVIESEGSGYYVFLYMDAYLDETPSAKVRHILIKATSSDGSSTPSESDMVYAKTQTDLLVDVWKSEGATEEVFATLADGNSQDTRDASGALSSPGGLFDPVYKGKFVPSLDEWIFDSENRTPGNVAVLENNGDSNYYGYHAVYFCGYNEGDTAWKATAKSALADEAATAHIVELMENYTVTEKSGINYVAS